ncbi:MAG: SH3 domain-containing protein, partial [Clostridia bacterium]|nr:SH3 domain-containing protein [Clostridia bacterium]
VVATASANSDKKEAEKTTTEESVSLDLEAIANMNSSNKNNDKTDNKAEDKKEPVASDSASDSVTEKPVTNNNKTSSYSTGTYKIATQEDPLGMRIQPNSDADRILYIDKGEEVEVLAVWDDWGYVVYNSTGGWLSMSYLELVSGN